MGWRVEMGGKGMMLETLGLADGVRRRRRDEAKDVKMGGMELEMLRFLM